MMMKSTVFNVRALNGSGCSTPSISYVLFAIPNAARRSARNGAYMKDEGMLPGVSDLILLKSNRHYGAL